jgi:hypothetical protein
MGDAKVACRAPGRSSIFPGYEVRFWPNRLLAPMEPSFLTAARHILRTAASALTVQVAMRADDLIRVDLKINDVPVSLVADTGAGPGIILFDQSADRVRVKSPAVGPTDKPAPGKAIGRLSEPCTMDGFGLVHFKTPVVVMASPGNKPVDIDGLIGWGFLKQRNLLLEAADSKFVVGGALPAATTGWTKFQVQPNEEILTLRASEPEFHGGVLKIDTGDGNGLSLSHSEWMKWKNEHPGHPVTLRSYFKFGTGFIVTEVAWAEKISILGLTLTNLTIQEADYTDTVLGGDSLIGVIGLEGLDRLDLAIDSTAEIAYANPRSDPSEPPNYNRCGAVFVPDNPSSDIYIAHVLENSPAFDAGIRNGDQLMQVNSADLPKGFGAEDSNDPFQAQAGTKVALKLRHEGVVYTTTVELRDLLGSDARTTSLPPIRESQSERLR